MKVSYDDIDFEYAFRIATWELTKAKDEVEGLRLLLKVAKEELDSIKSSRGRGG